MKLKNPATELMFTTKESEDQFKIAIDKLLQELADHKLIVEKLKQSEEHFRTLVETIEDYAIFSLDVNGNITSWNEGVEYILGYAHDEIIGMNFRDLYTKQDIEQNIPTNALNETRDYVIQEGLRVRKDGSKFHAVVTTTPIRDEDGKLKGFSQVIRDVTEKKEAEETIHFQAFHDSLTGLANRQSFYEKFAMAQSMAVRNNYKLAILFLDLDRFKIINDTLGHAVGDLILKEVADRLSKTVRKNDIVARLGGDEFILLLNEIKHPRDVAKICKNIINCLGPDLRLRNHTLHVSASFGIALFPENGEDIHTLLKNADIALYKAKAEGRSRYQFYNYEWNLLSSQLYLEQDLRRAVSESELELAYQPFINIKTGEIVG
ncbi:MAG TPA: diguanylate cyclase, partial [Verrucomicrobiae bacterium]|nr:diguanylate cyclase [Verrucomicrobiae bacterium]